MGASINYRVNPDKATSLEIEGWGIDKYEVGAIVFNTTIEQLVTYTGSVWVALEASTFVAPHGWGYYTEDQTVASTQVITTTPQKLTIDGLGSTSNSSYLPLEIRGISELWNTSTNKIEPISLGDDYTLRIDLKVTAKSGAPTELKLDLDIGGGASPSIVIVERFIATAKAPPYSISIGFPIFCLTTFVANGGQIFLATDTGTVTIQERAISSHRLGKGSI
jgi:hypothetical protein